MTRTPKFPVFVPQTLILFEFVAILPGTLREDKPLLYDDPEQKTEEDDEGEKSILFSALFS